jgi:hypothetical protein
LHGQSEFGVGVGGDALQAGVGVWGSTEADGAVGVRASGTGPLGTALEVLGVATFQRSGIAMVPAGASHVTVTGIPMSGRPPSMILALIQLATQQKSLAGKFWVTGALPDLGGDEFTIFLNRPPTVDLAVAWFVLN